MSGCEMRVLADPKADKDTKADAGRELRSRPLTPDVYHERMSAQERLALRLLWRLVERDPARGALMSGSCPCARAVVAWWVPAPARNRAHLGRVGLSGCNDS